MATVHNAYYNSPWIAEASRNLASALAPPDPEKQLAAKAAEWKFGRMQELAAIEDTDREKKLQIEDYRAEMLRPVLNPVTGEIDQKLTNAKILKNWADAIDIGDDPSIGAALSGELNPEVGVKRMIAQLKASQALGLAGFNWQQRGGLQDDAQAATADENKKNRAFQSEQNALRFKNYLDGINLRNKQASSGGGPNEIPVPIIKELTFGFDDFIFATGRDMPLEKYNKFLEKAGKRWQKNGNVQQSLNEQWAESFPNSRTYEGAEAEPDSSTWYSTQKGMLNPVLDDSPPEYSDAFAVPGVPPSLARPPEAAPAPAPPEKPKSKGTVAPPPKKRRPIESFGR